MKKLIGLLFAGNLVFNYTSAQETLQSVTSNGSNTNNRITVETANGGPMYTGRQMGVGYGYANPYAAVFYAKTDAAWPSNVYLFGGYHGTSSELGSGTNSFYVRGDGEGFFAGNVGIGTTAPTYKLDVNGSANFRGTFRVQSPGASNPTIGARNPIYLDAANYNSNSSAIVFVKGNEQVAEIASDIQANGGKDLYMMAGGNIVLDPWNSSGNIGIGTQSPQSKLAVNGIITSKKIKVTQEEWADYVFDSSYNLTPLHQVEQFIRKNKHLPEIPSATEVKKDGLDLGDNQAILLKKIEELTLYLIQQNKKIEAQEQELKELKARIKD